MSPERRVLLQRRRGKVSFSSKLFWSNLDSQISSRCNTAQQSRQERQLQCMPACSAKVLQKVRKRTKCWSFGRKKVEFTLTSYLPSLKDPCSPITLFNSGLDTKRLVEPVIPKIVKMMAYWVHHLAEYLSAITISLVQYLHHSASLLPPLLLALEQNPRARDISRVVSRTKKTNRHHESLKDEPLLSVNCIASEYRIWEKGQSWKSVKDQIVGYFFHEFLNPETDIRFFFVDLLAFPKLDFTSGCGLEETKEGGGCSTREDKATFPSRSNPPEGRLWIGRVLRFSGEGKSFLGVCE